ncbi:uncharacterized protein LOC116187927 isoform X2 [Punica granatum]|uniref:Uncharacterized protein n=2 Tax=Punica granatum TaxID=22663 RepID=A0A2I0KQ28_PUNGR|nr:uncharacterized protein LOC116187927 isoform X2 [Punica granatum]PKI70598.1 hypothetical protein CRG98_009103 [Punica granatum]
MAFGSVYRCLQELFPQLDARILKAVAIENSKDVHKAVEVVLMEILPSMTEEAKPPSSPQGSLGTPSHLDEEVQEEDEGLLLRRHRTVEKASASKLKFSVSADGSASSSTASDPAHPALVNEAAFWDAKDSIDQSQEASDHEVIAATKTAEEIRAAPMDQISHAQLVALHHFNVAKVPDELNGTAESEELILLGLMNKPPSSTTKTSCVAPSVIHDASDTEAGEGSADGEGTKGPQAHSADGDNKDEVLFPESLICQLEPLSVQKHAPEADSTKDVSAEYLNDINMTLEANYATAVGQDSGHEAMKMTRSAQIGEVDLLDQIIEDAKNNKKTLFSAMESVINTMKEVEEQERAAEQAREEAARRSSDISRRVEELKRMIQSAKEANDMHAGEIYGERAILATEVRELQSRLLSLSDERDRSLAILDEMRRVLEVRLTAAEWVIEAAEREECAKVEPAYSALKEQEALTEKVVHESKVLQEEAEENSKLREFLINRGRVVDQLQGEIAVICQDVKLLKERFDSGVALSKSISYGQTSCILASSSLSINSSASSDRIPDDRETCKAPNNGSLESSIDGSSPRKESEDKNIAGAEQKELSDEGWELCEN